MPTFEIPFPPKHLSPNARVHFMALAKAKKGYRSECGWLAKAANIPAPVGRVRVRLEFYPRTRAAYDQDNAIASIKAGIDGIADALGVDDSLFDLEPIFHSEPVKGGKVVVTI